MAKKGKRRNQTQLVIQALAAAEASIALAKQLLSAYGGGPPAPAAGSERASQPPAGSTRSIPGIVGKFDGDFMVTAEGKKYPVPSNYASKSQIVYGDTLKVIEKPDGAKIFKQIERVKRARVSGILAKKDGRWCVVTADGSYRVLPAAVAHHSGREGDEVRALIPLEDRHAPFAAIELLPARVGEKMKEERKETGEEEEKGKPKRPPRGIKVKEEEKKTKEEKPSGKKVKKTAVKAKKEIASGKPVGKKEEVGRRGEKAAAEKKKKEKTEPEEKKKKEKRREVKASSLADDEEEELR